MKNKTIIKKQGWLGFIGFLLGFQASLCLYILPQFLKEASGVERIEIFYLISYGASFYVLLNLHHLVHRYGKTLTFLVFVSIRMIALLVAGAVFPSSVAVIFMIWALLGEAISWVGLDILIESYSRNKVTGKIRGAHLTLLNAGFLLAPLLSTYLVSNFGFYVVFGLASFIMVIIGFITIIFFRGGKQKVGRNLRAKKVLKKMFARKNLMRIYYLALLLHVYYAMTTVYIPLHLLNQGVSWEEFGIILTIMLLPFVLFQFPLGVLSDKVGEKEMLFVAILIISVATFSLALISGTAVLVWGLLLFIGRTGAAIAEVGRDSYFYKKIGSNDVDFIDFFRTSKSVAYVVAMIIFGVLAIFLAPQALFVVLSVIVLSGMVPLMRLKDTG